jgi:hypothetical protein
MAQALQQNEKSERQVISRVPFREWMQPKDFAGQALGAPGHPSKILLSYNEPIWLSSGAKESLMTLPDPAWLAALAALITSLSSLMWSVRRKR